MSSFQSQFLGRISYAEALGLMQEFKAKRQNNEIGDQILFLEHQAVVTMGRKPSEKDLYLKKEELLKKNIDFVKTDRGGKLTYHGPGQLVIYFVCNWTEKNSLDAQHFLNRAEMLFLFT